MGRLDGTANRGSRKGDIDVCVFPMFWSILLILKASPLPPAPPKSEFGIQNPEVGSWNLEFGIRNLESRTWNSESRMWHSEFTMRNWELGIQNAELGIRKP